MTPMQNPPGKTANQKMLENVRALRAQGAPPERIKREIERWQPEIEAESAAERKLSGVEKVAAVGSKMGSGATFGLLDEAVGLFDEDAKNEQRFLQKQLSEENPKTAFAAEIAGSIATPGSIFKAAPKAAGMARKAGMMLAEGAAQGGIAGFGNAEGSLEDRIGATAKGATVGSVAAGVIGGVTRGGSRIYNRAAEGMGLKAPTLDELVSKIPDDDIASARANLSRLKGRNLAHEATVADVLPQGEGALRQAATAGGREVRKDVDAQLRQRMNRLANEADDRFSLHSGTTRQSGEMARAERLKKAQDEARPLYDQSRNEAGAYDPATEAPDFTMPEVLNRPRIKSAVRRVVADDPERFGGDVFADPKLSHDVLDQAYKDMGEEIRYIQSKVQAKTASATERRQVRRMIRDRDHLKKAIAVRSPSYPKALDKYAGEIAHRDAYNVGAKPAPADMIPEQMAALEPATVPDFKQGKAELLRGPVPNRDIGEFARFQDVLKPIATREGAETFKATFGDNAYREYVADLLEMAGLQKMKAGAGESQTVDKLMEQLNAEPEAIVGMVQSLLSGNPGAALTQAVPMKVLDRLRNNKTAKVNAEFLLRRGEPDVTRSLDELVAMRSAAQKPGPRRRSAAGVSARVVGSQFGGGQ